MDTKSGPPKERAYEYAERDYEDAIAHRYNRDYHEPPIMKWHSEEFCTFVGQFFKPGDRILDLGCGPASLWSYWNRYLPGADRIVGVDLSSGMIDEARRLYPSGDFRQGSFFSIPADAGSFDLVIVSSAFHHILDADLPEALREIHRVLDEHGMLIGREPLASGRVGDRGGWISGALTHLRHLAYRLTRTREYPEPDPGPAHHAYNAEVFLDLLTSIFSPMHIEFKNPVSPILSRVRHPIVAKIAKILDQSIDHREGQEIFYVSQKSYSTSDDVKECIRLALQQNQIDDIPQFLALVEAASKFIEAELTKNTNE